jgi:hypothetical protein
VIQCLVSIHDQCLIWKWEGRFTVTFIAKQVGADQRLHLVMVLVQTVLCEWNLSMPLVAGCASCRPPQLSDQVTTVACRLGMSRVVVVSIMTCRLGM